MTSVTSPLPSRIPEQQPTPAVPEQQPIDVLREQLIQVGVYSEALSDYEIVEMTGAHFQTAAEAVTNGIDADEAVELILDLDMPIFDRTHDLEFADRQTEGMSLDEAKTLSDEIRGEIRSGVYNKVAGEQDQTDKPNKGEKNIGIFGGVKTLIKRISLSSKNTRNAYKHYRLMDKAVNDAEPGSEDRIQAERDRDSAQTTYRVNRVKAFGGFALLGAGLDAAFVSKGVDASTVVSGLGLGLVAPAAAVKYEKRKLGDVVNDASLQMQVASQTFLNGLASDLTTKKGLKFRKLEKENPEEHSVIMSLDESISDAEEALAEYEGSDTFVEDSAEHQALMQQLQTTWDAYDEKYDELLDQYGKKHLTKKGRIAVYAGALVVAGIGTYMVSKYGTPTTSKGNHDIATPSGNNNSGSHNVPAPSGNSGSGSHSIPTPSGNGSSTHNVPAPSVPTPNGNGSSTQVVPTPFGDITIAPGSGSGNATTQQYHDFYNGFNPAEKQAFSDFIDGYDQIVTAHPDASQGQINELVTNTLNLAADKQEFVSQASNPFGRLALSAEYNEQFRHFIEQQALIEV